MNQQNMVDDDIKVNKGVNVVKVVKAKSKSGSRKKKQYYIKPKTHYILSDVLDIDKVSFSFNFFFRDKNDKSTLMMQIVTNYIYAPGLVSELNILHENSRLYSARIPQFAQYDNAFQHLKLNAPIRYADANNASLKNSIDLIQAKFVDFLVGLKALTLDDLTTEYTDGSVEQVRLIKKLHSWLCATSDRGIEDSFNKTIQANYDSDDEPTEQEVKRRQTRELYRMVPRIRSSTQITKLGSKKEDYENMSVDMKTFYEAMTKIYRMNKPESEYYYQANMIVGISSYFLNHEDGYKISFRPDCSKFEYKLNKAACKRVIKKKKIQQPLIISSLSV
jgi:hypothetical protein